MGTNYRKLVLQFAKVPSREKRQLGRKINLAAKRVQALFRELIVFNIDSRTKVAKSKKLKLLPNSTMTSVKKFGAKSAYLKDTADVSRMRLVARGAKIIGAGAILIDGVLAANNIKYAYESGGNTTAVAFEEVGGILGEAALASITIGLGISLGVFLIPWVGLLIMVSAGAAAAVGGNAIGKYLGKEMYKGIYNAYPATFSINSMKAL